VLSNSGDHLIPHDIRGPRLPPNVAIYTSQIRNQPSTLRASSVASKFWTPEAESTSSPLFDYDQAESLSLYVPRRAPSTTFPGVSKVISSRSQISFRSSECSQSLASLFDRVIPDLRNHGGMIGSRTSDSPDACTMGEILCMCGVRTILWTCEVIYV